MTSTSADLSAMPLRFNPPDGWRMPHSRWISLYQAWEPPAGWRPYPEAPEIPPSWPWWEENGTSWFRYFRDRPPIPTRALGNWFSLAALGLFTFAVSPFILPGWYVALGGISAVVLMVLGIRGVVRTYKTQSATPLEPLASIREWSAGRRHTYFLEAYQTFRSSSPRELTLEEFVTETLISWWAENPEVSTN